MPKEPLTHCSELQLWVYPYVALTPLPSRVHHTNVFLQRIVQCLAITLVASS